jgi:hypothetical protein
VVLHGETVDAIEGEKPADDYLGKADQSARNHDQQARRRQDRPVGRRRHVNGLERADGCRLRRGLIAVLFAPERIPAVDAGEPREVVDGRRRRDGPLERPAVPGIGRRVLAVRVAPVGTPAPPLVR